MKALKITGFIAGILIVTFLAITLSIDGMVKSNIEETGSALLKTDVDVDDVDISVFDGTGSISGFEVENPEGYSDEDAIRIEEATIKVDLQSLFSDQVVVNEIQIHKPELYFEQEGVSANLKELNDRLNSASGDESGKKLIIERLLIEKGYVKVSTDIDRERTAEAEIDQFELTDIGKNGSNTVQQSVKQIMEPLLKEAITEAATAGVLDQLKNKAKDLIDG